MNHGGCCNCFVCKLGKALGLVEDCKCETKAAKKTVKKVVKKTVKKVAKKKTVAKRK